MYYINLLAKVTKRDKINDYLNNYRSNSEEVLEENFKNLFAASGKISNLVVGADCKVYFIK